MTWKVSKRMLLILGVSSSMVMSLLMWSCNSKSPVKTPEPKPVPQPKPVPKPNPSPAPNPGAAVVTAFSDALASNPYGIDKESIDAIKTAIADVFEECILHATHDSSQEAPPDTMRFKRSLALSEVLASFTGPYFEEADYDIHLWTKNNTLRCEVRLGVLIGVGAHGKLRKASEEQLDKYRAVVNEALKCAVRMALVRLVERKLPDSLGLSSEEELYNFIDHLTLPSSLPLDRDELAHRFRYLQYRSSYYDDYPDEIRRHIYSNEIRRHIYSNEIRRQILEFIYFRSNQLPRLEIFPEHK
jgi:hypothetical protein